MKKLIIFFTACFIGLGTAWSETVIKTIPSPWGYYSYGLTWDGEHLWCGDDHNGDIAQVDTSDGTVLKTISGPGTANHGLAWDGEYLWVAGDYTFDEWIFKIDTLGNIIDSIPSVGGDYPGGLTWDGQYLWVARYYPNTQPNLFKLNPANGDPVDTIPSQGLQPQGLAWDGTYLWNVMDDNDDDPEKVWALDPSDGDTIMSFWVPGAPGIDARPRGLTWDGQYLWLVAKDPDSNDQLIYKIDPYGAGTPRIQLSATEHDYGEVTVNDSVDWNLEITNIGGMDLVVDSMNFDDPAFFTSTVFPETVKPDSSIQVPITFSPTSLDTFTGTGTVYSNDPVYPTKSISLEGIGVAAGPEIDLPELSHNYGWIRVGATKRWFCQINSLGEETLVLDSVKIDSPEFWVSGVDFPVNIPTLSSFELPVWFSPPAGGSFSATLTIYNNDLDESEVDVSLSGYGDDSPNPGGEVLWYYNATNWDPSIKAIISIPDINGDGVDEVVASSENDTLYCFNGGSSGEADVLWTFDLYASYLWRDQELVSVCDIDGDRIDDVVIGTPWGGRSVVAISAASGDTLWIYDTHEYGGGGWVYEVAEMVDVNDDGICDILAASGDDGNGTGPGRVYCLSGLDGSKIWEKRLLPQGINIAVFSVRAIDDFTDDGIPEVAAGSGDTSPDVARVWMLDGATGDIIWSEEVGDAVWSVVPIEDISGDRIADVVAGIGVGTGSIWAFDATNGDSLWKRPVDGGVEQLYIIGDVNGNGIDDLLPSGLMSNFYCLDGFTGDIIWSTPSGHKAFSSVPIPDLTGDLKPDVIGGSGYSYNYVYCLNGVTGDIVWTHPADGAVECVYWMHSIDRQSAEALSGSRNGQVLCLSGGLTLYGAIRGKVTDETTSQPIESAVVTADGHIDTTDVDGDYFISLPTGFYEMIAGAQDYYPETTNVMVTVNDTTTVNFALTPIFIPPQFIRGDADSNMAVEMPDAVYILRYKFIPGSPPPSCLDAGDADDNGLVEMPDAVYILRYKFIPGSPPPPLPFPGCGVDPTEDELGCDAHPCGGGRIIIEPSLKKRISTE